MVGKLKVSAVLQALPGIGKVQADQIMEKLKIAESRRLRGLGEQQRKALLGEFAAIMTSPDRVETSSDKHVVERRRARRLGSPSCPALPGSARTA